MSHNFSKIPECVNKIILNTIIFLKKIPQITTTKKTPELLQLMSSECLYN